MKLTKAKQDKMLEAKRAKENETEGRGRGNGRGRGRGGGRGKTSAVPKASGKKGSKGPDLGDQPDSGDNTIAEEANEEPEAPPLPKKGRQPKMDDPTEPPTKKKKAEKTATAKKDDANGKVAAAPRSKRGKAAQAAHEDSEQQEALPPPKKGKKEKVDYGDGKSIAKPAANKTKAAKAAENDCDNDSKHEVPAPTLTAAEAEDGNQSLLVAESENAGQCTDAPSRKKKQAKPASVAQENEEIPAPPKKRGRPPKDTASNAVEASCGPGPKRKKQTGTFKDEAEPSKRKKDVQTAGSNGPKQGPSSPSKLERANQRKAMREEFCIPDYHFCEVVMYWSRSAIGLKWRNTKDPEMNGKQAMQDTPCIYTP